MASRPPKGSLAAYLGLRSRGHVAGQLASLNKKGWIDYGRQARSIRIIADRAPKQLETPSTERLRGMIEEAVEELARQIGRPKAADVLASVLSNQRAPVKREAEQRKPGRPHRFSPK